MIQRRISARNTAIQDSRDAIRQYSDILETGDSVARSLGSDALDQEHGKRKATPGTITSRMSLGRDGARVGSHQGGFPDAMHRVWGSDLSSVTAGSVYPKAKPAHKDHRDGLAWKTSKGLRKSRCLLGPRVRPLPVGRPRKGQAEAGVVATRKA